MRGAHTIRLGTMGAFLTSLFATYSTGQSQPDYRKGSLPLEEVQPVYSPDLSDSWNRIFNALFSRTVRSRLSKEFAGAASLERVKVMGFADLPVSTSVFKATSPAATAPSSRSIRSWSTLARAAPANVCYSSRLSLGSSER